MLAGLPASAAVKPGKTGGSAAKKVTEQTFVNKEAGLSWSYPKPWEAVSIDDLNKDSERAAQLQYASGKYIAVLTVYRTEDDAPQKTASTLTSDLIKESKKQKNFIKSTTLTINKQKVAGFLRYEPLEGGGKEKVFRILIPGEGAYYEAVLGIVPQKTASISSKAAYQLFDKMLAPATAIVQSLRLSKPVLGPTVEYRKNDYAFALSYPKERWQQDTSADGTTDSVGDTIVATFNSPTGSLTVNKVKDTRGSLENYYENTLAQYEAAGFTVVSTGSINHKAGKAYQMEYIVLDEGGGSPVHFFATYIAKDDTIYELSYLAVRAGYFRYLNTAKRAVASFHFIEPSYALDTAYEDNKTPARFFYPHEWKIQPPDYINDVVVASSARSVGVGYSGGFEPSGAPATLEQYAKDSAERFTALGWTDLRQSSAVMGGLPAIRFSGNIPGTQRIVTVMTLRNGKASYFSYITLDDATRDRFLPLFEQIVASFQFIQ